MNENPNLSLLRCHLAAFVPLLIQEFLERRRTLILPRLDLAEQIAANGDAILHRVPGRTAPAVSALVEAVATLAFAPGGVSIFGLHFEVPPRQAMALLAGRKLPPIPPAPRSRRPAPASGPTFETIFRRQIETVSGAMRHGPR